MNAIGLIAAMTVLAANAALLMLVVAIGRKLTAGTRDFTLDALLRTSTSFILAATLAVMVTRALQRPYSSWDEARFAMTMALAHGDPLYPKPTEGAQLNAIYGPVGPMVYLPAMIAVRPDVAMILAGLIAQVFFLAPLAIACFSCRSDSAESRCPRFQPTQLLLFGFAVLASASSPALNYSGFRIHVDAPALGFAGLACLVAQRATTNDSFSWIPRSWMTMAALLASLAVFSKQSLIPVPAALVVHVALTRTLKEALQFAILLFAIGATTFCGVGAVFGFQEFLFHAFTVPSSHCLWRNPLGALPLVAESCLWFAWIPLSLMLLKTAIPAATSPIRQSWTRAPWLVFAVTSIFCLPTVILAVSKTGGDVNSLSPVAYFLLLAAIFIAEKCLRGFPHAAYSRIATAFMLSITLGLATRSVIYDLPRAALLMRKASPTYIVYEYSRRNPGNVYFPWHPAAVLAAEGNLYHFYYGLYDRELAGRPLTLEHIAGHIPSDAKYILLDRENDEDFFSKYFPDFKASDSPIAPPVGLPGRVLERRAPAVRE